MNKLAGVKFEKDVHGKVKKVTLDMKYHATFVDDYLDHLRIEEAKKTADFVPWESIKKELDNKHGVNSKKLQNSNRAQSRKTA
ncbi:MAG: hypothetical protein K0Q79_238 [Flavipsychrobacter sp.]|jgi:hypothetical protein|nr:hypothetical protein [Flavipsychrobacter sp.]